MLKNKITGEVIEVENNFFTSVLLKKNQVNKGQLINLSIDSNTLDQSVKEQLIAICEASIIASNPDFEKYNEVNDWPQVYYEDAKIKSRMFLQDSDLLKIIKNKETAGFVGIIYDTPENPVVKLDGGICVYFFKNPTAGEIALLESVGVEINLQIK